LPTARRTGSLWSCGGEYEKRKDESTGDEPPAVTSTTGSAAPMPGGVTQVIVKVARGLVAGRPLSGDGMTLAQGYRRRGG